MPKGQARRWRSLVLTGGPGGGKSSLRAPLAAALEDHADHVLVAPEAARLVIETGFPVTEATREPLQRAIMELQVQLRCSLTALAAELPGKVVVIFDRAEPDGSAYLPPEAYLRLLAGLGLTPTKAREQYDVVLHLQTAAAGAEQDYALDAARAEDAAAARALDVALLAAWAGHPARVVVPTAPTFDEKVERVVVAATEALSRSH